MDNIKTPRGLLKHPTLAAWPLPIPLNPEANRGAIVLAEDGQLYAASRSVVDDAFVWTQLTSSTDFTVTVSGQNFILVYVKEGAEDRNLVSMLSDPPITPSRAVPTLARASEFVNATTIAGRDIQAVINIASGLYSPACSFDRDTLLVAWDEDFTAPLYPSTVEEGNIIPLDGDGGHDHFKGQGYGDLTAGVHFVPYSGFLPTDNTQGLFLENFAGMSFGASVQFRGAFFFLSIADQLKLHYEHNVLNMHEGREDILGADYIVGATGLVGPSDYSTIFSDDLDTNLDTYISGMISVLGATITQGRGGWNRGLINLSGGEESVAEIRDIVFGAGPPGMLKIGSDLRAGFIDVSNSVSVEVGNIYLRGRSRLTSTGAGLTGALIFTNGPYIGEMDATVNISAPWVWECTCPCLISARTVEARITFGFGLRHGSVAARRFNYFQSLNGQPLPNHIHLLNNDGSALGTATTGPWMTCVLACNNNLSPFPRQSGWHAVFGDGVAIPGEPNTLSGQGFLGSFGLNGYNDVKTRGAILRLNTAQNNDNTRERGFILNQGRLAVRTTGTTRRGPWLKAGVPRATRIADARFDFQTGTEGPGQAVDNDDIWSSTTANDGRGVNMACRTWIPGVDVTSATIIQTLDKIIL